MPYVDRQNRICGFLDIEENETCGKFLRRYFILDTQANHLLWYMDNPQNLAIGAGAVGSLQLTYISKVSIATPKQKPKTPFCFVINALSQRYFLQASDQKDLQDWVEALNRASKITVPKGGSVPPATEITKPPVVAQDRKPQVAYKTEIVGGVVVHTPISINQDGGEGSEVAAHPLLRRSQSYIPPSAAKPPAGPPPLKSGFCVKQGNVRKSWKRRYFVLDEFSISYYKCEQDKEPLRSILLKDVCKTHECLVKSGDLLMRDNLFEIITSSRTFYIQADSPEDMHSWIRAITGAVQALKTRPREMSFVRCTSMARPGGSSAPSQPRPAAEERRASCKAPSTSSWQPWTPVPQAEGQRPAPLRDSVSVSALAERDGRAVPGTRLRHRSEPQHPKEKPFAFDLDDESIRTSDV
ncbi:pleckstrin homology domain-containing family A member 2 [Corvus cornix cornix]|uniref:pleckstrin homology domain-containing family A member 2 n=1 Tax=Corvus cornix cornix TaxID=932674 RepID=UPI00195174B4|nr:pleckstrin homology domain-containing family A member 2 [Corvus cornix cornix]XP_039420276.1 pleckstrin homology domain-containing family A member 2 [Corvus cornix cornix]XP_039420277.1 pleckstrin homology domain-containing family A member 2 [Corvus cornix cornix]XP_039420278.1 pleckstrin homology domain-containing family A member 2 [Corvus cornix cornix]XP_048143426.1 pleckstrin homology domain-containing family A member 2 [Corvus hawaiiensis]XP_048143427.1 pleckstrin homology domain-conta